MIPPETPSERADRLARMTNEAAQKGDMAAFLSVLHNEGLAEMKLVNGVPKYRLHPEFARLIIDQANER